MTIESEIVVHEFEWSVDWGIMIPIVIGILALAVVISLLVFRRRK